MLIPLGNARPTYRTPFITVFLIIANIGSYIYQMAYDRSHFYRLAQVYGAVPYELTHFSDVPPFAEHTPYLSLIVSLFLHANLLHLLGNMLYLYTFGPNVEDIMGHFRFILFYLFGGLIATIAFALASFRSLVPLIGASGAIAGVMGAHFIAFPGARIKCLFFIFIVPLPAVVVLLPWIIMQFANLTSSEQSQVAWLAHVVGFLSGMFLLKKFKKGIWL